MSSQDIHKYDDIINLPRPISKNHPRMPLADRAAQFAPFAALTGHEAAMRETARLTEEKITLGDEAIADLNEKMKNIVGNIGTEQKVTITYFVPDERKKGGAYVTYSGVVKKIDRYNHILVMTDGTVIPIGQICEIGGELSHPEHFSFQG